MKADKIEAVITKDENGDNVSIPKADYVKQMISEYSVEAIETEEFVAGDKQIVEHVIKACCAGKDVDEEVSSRYPSLVSSIAADIETTLSETKSKAELAAEAKEAKEKEKSAKAAEEESKKLELAKTQETFVEKVASGADLAEQEFGVELKNLAEGMPDGVKVVSKNGGYGVEVATDASIETVGAALGYMMQKSANSQFVGNQLQFWVGDIVSHTVRLGVYANASEASKSISALLDQQHGKRLSWLNVDAYKRMAERTPIELRNPRADTTAYLAVASMKLPKKEEKETEESFKKRQSEFESDREALQSKLATGEVIARKDILEPINEVLYKHKLKDRPSEDKGVSIMAWLQIYFHASYALEHLSDVHEEGVIMYKEGDKKIPITVEEMQEKRAEAESNLSNSFGYYNNKKAGITPRDFSVGYVTKKVKVELGKNDEGKMQYGEEDLKSYVFPEPFFATPKEEEKKEEVAATA